MRNKLFFSSIISLSLVWATTINVPADQTTIQAGINAATNGDTVLVQPGTYVENINFNGKNIVVGSLFLTTADTSYISSTIIDGNAAGTVVTFNNGEDTTAVLCGFTITNGLHGNGGGIRCDVSSPSLNNLRISGNTSDNGAGGINIYHDSNPSIVNVTITDNIGSGIKISWNSNPSTNNILISGNNSYNGGGIYCSSSSPTLANVIIKGNTASNNGGGIYLNSSNPTLTNLAISNNTAIRGGGIYQYINSSPSLFNLTISGNTASNGGGIYNDYSDSNPSMLNSIMSGNSPEEIFINNGTVTATYSLISGGWSGTGNIDGNPWFVDADNGDYRLMDYSLAIGAGTASGAPATDLDGNPRPNPGGSNPDIGAYENARSAPLPYDYVHVNAATGNDAGSIGVESAPFATIQAAIDFSQGDTVLVHPGTYNEAINFNGKSIAVGSEFMTTGDTSYISSTIIDANRTGRVVTFENGEGDGTALIGLTLTDGYAVGANATDRQGGGIRMYRTTPFLSNLRIIDNEAAEEAGGIYIDNTNGGSMRFENLDVIGNTADLIGGVYVKYSTRQVIFNSLKVKDNTSNAYPGGICFRSVDSLMMKDFEIRDNTGTEGSFLIEYVNNDLSSINLSNGIIANNSDWGLYIKQMSNDVNVTIDNVSIANNGALGFEFTDFGDVGGSVEITNSIIDVDAGSLINPDSPDWSPTTLDINYSLISGTTSGTGNIAGNPLFVDPTNGDYHLSDYSPAIGAGTASGAPTTDLDGNSRPNPGGSNPDMGAYESARSEPLPYDYVHVNAATGNNAGSIGVESAPFATIQAAMDFSTANDTVLVHPGTYVENINFNGKNIVVGSLVLTTGDTSYISSTIIDGNQAGSVVTFNSEEDSTAELSGFTITNGSAANGGGILCFSGYAPGPNPSLANLIISENTASVSGGGIYCYYYSNPSLVNITISGNTTSEQGGGIACISSSNPSLVNVIISGNTASVSGGGVYCEVSSPSLISVTISENSAVHYGGGLYLKNSSPSLVNVTISGNSAANFSGGGIYNDNATTSTTSLLNTIISGNSPDEIYIGSGTMTATYSLIQGGWTGTGNIDVEPYFVDATNGDYHLSDYSPAIGAGTASGAPTTDLDGNPRPNPGGSNPDIGAYENSRATPAEIPPGTPQNLTATYGNQQVSLRWDQNSDADLAKYRIYRSTTSPAATLIDSVVASSPPDTFYTDTGLTNGQIYYYRITAVDSAGTVSDGYSNEVSATPNPIMITVKKDGSGDYTVIQTAIDASTDEDTVLVYAGTYTENINFNGKNIVVGSLFLTTQDTSYISSTIIDGNQSGSVVLFGNGVDATAELSAFTIRNGSADLGGGIYCFSASPKLNNLIISGNVGNNGGGLTINYSSNPRIVDITITGNTATNNGGGLFVVGNSNPSLENVFITGNTATNSGGGISYSGSSPSLLNVIIEGNNANNSGGGIYCTSSSPSFVNVTISGNISGSNGGGIYSSGISTNASLLNTIMSGNSPEEIHIASGTVTATYSLIQGGWTGTGNIDVDPLFVDAANGNYHLTNYSPAIGAGTATGAPITDLDGNARPNPGGSNPDIGAYENSLGTANAPPTPTSLSAVIGNSVVNLSWTGNAYATNYSVYRSETSGSGFTVVATGIDTTVYANSGLTNNTIYYYKVSATGAGGEGALTDEISATPTPQLYTVKTDESGDYTVIQTAIDASTNADTVLVYAGTYTENINFNGKNIVVGSLFLTTADASYISSTIIDGNQAGSVVTFENWENSTAILSGFTVRNGSGRDGAGGGIYCNSSSSPNLKNLTVTGNAATNFGGGIYCTNSSNPNLVNVTISGNAAMNSGGGIYCTNSSSPNLVNVKISGNTVPYYGGGIYCGNSSSLSLVNVTIAGNTSSSSGGGGGGIYFTSNSSNPSLVNVTISGNTAAIGGGLCNYGTPTLLNTIVSGNSPEEIHLQFGSVTATYSLIQGGWTGTGNIDADPLFVDAANGNYRLTNYSPAIGSGAVTGAPTTDIDGNPRPNPGGSNPDMGAYENSLPSQCPKAGSISDGLSQDMDWSNSTTALSINWSPFIDNSTVNYAVAIGSSSGSADILDWTVVGTDTFYTASGLSLSEASTYYLSVRGTDSDSQVSDTTTTDGITIDLTLPLITAVYEGALASDRDYQNQLDSLVISWTGSDAASGLAGYEYALGTSSGGTETVGWTACGLATSDTLTTLSLVDGATYYLSIRVTDVAGNLSSIVTGDGIMIDIISPIAGQVNDGSGDDIVYTASDNTLSANWSGFSDAASGIAYYEYAIGTTSGVTDVMAWENAGNTTSMDTANLSLNNGQVYYVSIRATDNAGNVSQAATSNGVIADLVGPLTGTASDGLEADLDWTNSTTTLSGKWSGFVDELSGIDYYEYALGTSGGGSDIVNWTNNDTARSITLNSLILNEGVTYHFSVRAVDSVNNTSDEIYTDGITVDLTLPVVTSIFEGSVAADRDYQNSDVTLPIAWAGSDDASGVIGYEYALGSTSGTADIVNWTAAGIKTADTLSNLSLIDYNTYYVSIRVTDLAGNLSAIATGNGITIDMIAPVTGTVYDGPDSDITFTGVNDSLAVNWTGFSDVMSGIADYDLAIGSTSGGTDIVDWVNAGNTNSRFESGLSLLDATIYYASIQARDVAGNTSAIVSSDGVTVDTSEPLSQVTIAEDFYNSTGWDVTTQIIGNASDAVSGLERIEIRITRDSDNADWDGSGWLGSEQWLLATGTSDWSYDLGSTGFDDGIIYTVNSRAVDAVGNLQSNLGSDSFIYDMSEPESYFALTENYYSSMSWDSAVQIAGSAIDSYSGITRIEVRVENTAQQLFWDGSDWVIDEAWVIASGTDDWQYSMAGAAFTNAENYSISIRSTDGAGNSETSYAADSFIYDDSAPLSTVTIDLDFYNSNSWADASSINGAAADSLSGLALMEIAIQRSGDDSWWGGTSWGMSQVWLNPTGLDNWTYSFNGSNLTNGVTYTVYARGTDNTGNLQTIHGSDSFTYDLTAPTITQVNDGTTGADQAWTSSTNTLSANWSEFNETVSGIALYSYGIGTTAGATDVLAWTDNGTELSFTATDLSLQSGTIYYASVIAIDGAGNTSSTATSDGITVDAVAPIISAVFEGAIGGDIDYQQDPANLILSWEGSDNESRTINFYQISLGSNPAGNDVVDWVDVTGTTNYTFSNLSLVEGVPYYGNVKIIDMAGNPSDVVSGDGITVDQTSPSTGQVFDGDSVDVDWVTVNFMVTANWAGFTDALSGIAQYEYSIGLNPGETQTLPWVSSGLDTNFSTSASLTEGPTYYVNIRAIDSVGITSSVVSSNGFGLDQSAPIVGTVSDGTGDDIDWTTETTVLSANWSGFNDAYSGIDFYDYSIGSSSGATDVVDWTDIDTSSFVSHAGLSLESGLTYYFNLRATDLVGHVSGVTSTDGITIDTIPPVLSSVYEGGVGEDFDFQQDAATLILSWTGSDGMRDIDLYQVSLGTSTGDSNLVDWVDVTGATDYSFSGLSLVEGVPCYGNVRIRDMAGNISPIVSGDGITVDQTGPSAGQVFDGDSTDIDWVSIDYLIAANWAGFTDALSGIAEYEYSVGLNPGETQVLTWASSALDTFFSTSASINEGASYYVNIRAIDSVGITGSVVSSNGFGLDQTAPVVGTVLDGLVEDIDWTTETTTLSATWTGFSDTYSGIDFYDYSIGTSSGATNVVDWTDNDTNLTITHNSLFLENGLTYYFNIRATDLVGNVSATINTDGTTIDTIPSVISSIFEGSTSADLDYQASDSTVILSWTGSDDASGIEHYEYAIGTTAGGTEMLDWTAAGLALDVLIPTPALLEGTTYFGSVRSYDLAGNLSDIASGDGITIDLTPPATGNIIDGLTENLEFTGSTNTLAASWSGFSDTYSGIQYYEYAIGSSPDLWDVKGWTGVQLDSAIEDGSLTLSDGETYYFLLRAVDNVDNISNIITSDGIIADHSPPVGNWVIDGDSTDIDQQNKSTTYIGKWASFSDLGAGLQNYEYALYDTTTSIYYHSWTTLGLDTILSLTDLTLINDRVYQLMIRGVDLVGNVGSEIKSDGVLIDFTAPLAPENLVGYFSHERIKLEWDASTEPDFSYYSIYAGETADPATAIMTVTEPLAEAYIDGFTSETMIYLRITTTDIPGNEGPYSNQVTGIPREAIVTHVSPDEHTILQADERQISVHFSQPLNNIGSVAVSSPVYPSMNITAGYSEPDTAIVIDILDPLASMDTLELAITGIIDWADTGTSEKNVIYYTYLLADYNNDFTIDVNDLADFLYGWDNENLSYELGPVTGTCPQFIPLPDNNFDLRDIMTFVRMWDWYHQYNQSRVMLARIEGEQPEIVQAGNSIIISLPKDADVGQVAIQYFPSQSQVNIQATEYSKDLIVLQSNKNDQGQLLIEYAFLDPDLQKQLVFDTRSLTEINFAVEVNYTFISDDRQLVGQGSQRIELIAVPEKFALQQNYPNPFNPITTIKYELPADSKVNIVIYDIMGRQVIQLLNEFQEAGFKSIKWNGRNTSDQIVSAGLYFYAIEAGKHNAIRKMVLLK